jgi:hypothetical protein
MKTQLRLWGVLSAVVAGVVASPASANIGSLAVSSCRQTTSSGSPSYDWTGIQNTSSTDLLYLDCSNAIDGGVGAGYQTTVIFAYTLDQSSGTRVSCTAKVVDYSGDILWQGSTLVGSQPPGHVSKLSWLGVSPTQGSPYVSCAVPPTTPLGKRYELNGMISGH